MKESCIKKRESLMKPMQDEIYNAVKLISEEKGYQVVVDRASAMSIILHHLKLISVMKFY
jgi:hypothetical protein